MFEKDASLFTEKRPIASCHAASELHTFVNLFSVLLPFINDANETDDPIEQIKYLASGFV